MENSFPGLRRRRFFRRRPHENVGEVAPPTPRLPPQLPGPSTYADLLRPAKAVTAPRIAPIGAADQPLLWLDMEMTGLDVDLDRILEIACIITDKDLNELFLFEGVVINQSEEFLDRMVDFGQGGRTLTKLKEEVRASVVSLEAAEDQVLDFIGKSIQGEASGYTKLQLAGTTVYTDYQFIKKYMPRLEAKLSYMLVDVTSVTALCRRWYPSVCMRGPPPNLNQHRALPDIRQSIALLRYYKDNIFV